MQIETIKDIVVLMFFISLVGIFVFFLYWNILYLFLTRKYDKSLFRKPYFNENELAIYSTWPFSLVKSTAYILLITGSSIAKKRFKDLKEPIIETATVKFFCHFWKTTLFIIIGMFIVGLAWGTIDILINT